MMTTPLPDSVRVLTEVFGGVFGTLTLASVVGLVLHQRHRRRHGANTPHAVIDNLNDRLRAWWVMIGALALAFLGGRAGVIGLFGLVSLQCLREFIASTDTRHGDHQALLWMFYGFLPLQYTLVAVDWYGLLSILIPVYGFLMLPIFSAMSADTTRFLNRTAQVQWGLMVSVYCLSHIPALLLLEIPGFENRQLQLVAFLVLVVQASDVCQYLWGKLLGRYRLAPQVSPSKTVEGLVGGVLSASALGTALWWLTPFAPWQAALIALLITVMGFFGGLVLSAIKRERGLKDWGHLIEGHGGMLDRVDSLSFAAPIFFHVLRYWWVP